MITLIDQSAQNNTDQSATPVFVYQCSDCQQQISARSRAEAEQHAMKCPARANARPDVVQLAADMVAMRQRMILLEAENAALKGQAQTTPGPVAEAPKPKRRGRPKKAETLTE